MVMAIAMAIVMVMLMEVVMGVVTTMVAETVVMDREIRVEPDQFKMKEFTVAYFSFQVLGSMNLSG